MKKTLILAFAIFLSLITFLFCSNVQHIKPSKYTFESVEGDPLKARIYTLDNGFKVYMTVYKDAPRIQTIIPVRVGSKNDPAETTGLAHYLEHLLFKGTDEYGTLDFEKEKLLLDEITQLYEVYRQESDTLKRRLIYAQIDSISYLASKYSVAGEYDKMLSFMGAKGTNAFTGNDLTCYINDIPANQIEQWLTLESERFRDPVLRLFHTELEVVYEEKNMSMDRDGSKLWEALYAGLWPTHPYGTQTTLGHPDHLKNPSIQNVYDYFNRYYVPNNMALCLSGDFDPDSMIVMIDATFGTLEPGDVLMWEAPIEDPIASPIEKEVLGPDKESVSVGFRLPGVNDRDAELLLITDYILSNGVAGLIDLNLKQKQVVINPYSGADIMNDYSSHYLSARPREGQSLDEVRDHLLAQIDSIKAGAFPEWLPGAVVKNLKKREISQYDRNWGRAFAMVMAFIQGKEWKEVVHKWDALSGITKEDIVDFANKYYGNNYVVVYKRTGEDTNVVKIEKPPISPVELNRDQQSEFLQMVSSIEIPDIQPDFLDFNKDIQFNSLELDIPVLYTPNTENELFTMYYIMDRGSLHDPRLPIAMQYLRYLGTSKYSPDEFKQELYKLACSFGANSNTEQSYVYFSGLNENFKDGLILFEHLLEEAQANNEILENLINDILKKRADDKLNKETIMFQALSSYGKYGPNSPFTNILSEEELKDLKPEELIEIIKEFMSYEHRVLYYGPLPIDNLVHVLNTYRRLPDELSGIKEVKMYDELPTNENKVYLVNYDMKQVQIIMYSKSVPFDKDKVAVHRLFNEYYGGNMSSVVFQTLRESKALAYSVYGAYESPYKKDRAHYILTFIATQNDKLGEAMDGMMDLMNNMAESQESFNDSKRAQIRKIQTERITKMSVLWNYERAVRQGWSEYDIRKVVYDQVPDIEMEDLREFFDNYIKDHQYTTLVMGDINNLDLSILKQYGPVQELSLEEIFGY